MNILRYNIEVIYNNQDRIETIDWLFDGWNQQIEMTPKLFKIYNKLIDHNNKEDYYKHDSGVLHFMNDGLEYTNK